MVISKPRLGCHYDGRMLEKHTVHSASPAMLPTVLRKSSEKEGTLYARCLSTDVALYPNSHG